MKLLLDIDIPIELTNGNDGRGKRWFSSAELRKAYEAYFRAKPKIAAIRFTQPTRNVVTRVLGKAQRLWDSSSIGRGNWKEIEDALVAIGWWPDDGPAHIVKTEFEQDASRRKDGPVTNVKVYAHDIRKTL